MAKVRTKWLRALSEMMASYGFKLKRNENHLVWRNDEMGIQIATSSSPSDLNAIRQIERDIRRKLALDHPWCTKPCMALAADVRRDTPMTQAGATRGRCDDRPGSAP
ncbi:hypothetical protein SPRG_10978 [Saprolegnia parasitica CBS 223.65]|uniref:Uncharacterized protein n=2 Tax=Saprolegnia TaxID=4769 RepID=A0A067BWL4_SAPPC|nr:hypothetical protein SPRG_10978 [Saprolegnia parasitica CBS 223.65]KDO22663.1 hypothetical protein SPRG_10978 [Saprolegnia parasitica CBS 223.65]|eukprot:XP_012206580.1 hypothetical protein SPRG_10978 [Saprolegnia parasitica CBS 223.65]